MPLGLTAMADYAGIVCLLVSARLHAARDREPRPENGGDRRADDWASRRSIKPSNLIFLAARLVALLAARRWRELVVVGAAALPALVALAALEVPRLRLPARVRLRHERDVALGTEHAATTRTTSYVEHRLGHLATTSTSLREVFWSMRVAPVAAVCGRDRRRAALVPARALCSRSWFWSFFVLKGSSTVASVDSGSFFRFLLPAIPAFLLLAASLPLLIPKYGLELVGTTQRLPEARARSADARSSSAAVLLGLVPIVAPRPRPRR